MSELHFYISNQEEGLALFGPYDKEEAEATLLQDAAGTLGLEIYPDEYASIIEDALSDTGFELDASDTGTDDVVMYLRKVEIKQ